MIFCHDSRAAHIREYGPVLRKLGMMALDRPVR